MSSAPPSSRIFRFGLFELDAARNTLIRSGARVKIQDQPFRVLVMLLERPGEIVTREELRQRIWPEGTFVDFEGSLNVIFKRLRAALDDDPDNPRFIETVPRKGYRFIAPVTAGEEQGTPSAATLTPPERVEAATAPVSQPGAFEIRSRSSAWRHESIAWITGLLLLLSFVVFVWIRSHHERGKAEAANFDVGPAQSVAVIPFSNSSAGPSFDYLRFAIASDVVTDLTYARSISVRAFRSTSRYGSQPADPETVGRELKVSYVISGDLTSEQDELKITAEMTRVADGRVIWRDNVSAAPNELVHLHENLTLRLRNEVVAALADGQMAGEIPSPHNERAYDLYLRALAIPHDPEPNKLAIAELKESVQEDPSYGPAWDEFAWREYIDAAFGDGGEAAYKLSEEARARAATLDPDGNSDWATIEAEHGNLKGAYDMAQGLLARRPDAWGPHFEMSYVFRYAGLLDQAAKECDMALAIDGANYGMRSCSKVFMYRGDYKRAAIFVGLDGSSGWAVRQRMQFALRQKQEAEALVLATIAEQGGYRDSEIVVARLRNEAPAKLNAIAEKAELWAAGQSDPEEKYELAAMLAYAGQADQAMRLLEAAIRRNYCATPLLESDSLLASLRARPDFQKLRNLATACQRNFLARSGALASEISSKLH